MVAALPANIVRRVMDLVIEVHLPIVGPAFGRRSGFF
jgi:hypothetical protein